MNVQNSKSFSEIVENEFKNEIDIFTPLSSLKSNVPQNTFEISDKIVPLKTWFANIVIKVRSLRGVETPNNDLGEIFRTLEENNFSFNERKVAETWLLKGNWAYKSPKRITIDDFYPDANKLKEFKDILIYSGTLQELVNSIRLYAYNESSRNFERWIRAKEQELLENDLETQISGSRKVTFGLELVEEKAKNADLLAKVKKLEEQLKKIEEQNYDRVERIQSINQDLNNKLTELEAINAELEAKNEKLMIEAAEYWAENA